jgi:hypothetical protein
VAPARPASSPAPDMVRTMIRRGDMPA